MTSAKASLKARLKRKVGSPQLKTVSETTPEKSPGVPGKTQLEGSAREQT